MLASNYTTYVARITALPLTELSNPIHTISALRFVADNASLCVAEALMDCLISNDMRRTGRDRKSSMHYLLRLIDLDARANYSEGKTPL